MATAEMKTKRNMEAKIAFNTVQKAIFILSLLSTMHL